MFGRGRCELKSQSRTQEVGVSFIQMDRAIGTVIGSAVGDALGAGYEFAPVVEPGEVEMRRGTLTGDPAGHWTDDTAMAIAILETAAVRGTLLTSEAQAAVGDRFLDWYRSDPPDVGTQTRNVLSRTSHGSELNQLAAQEQRRDPDRAGNGSLMRTAAVALAHLGDDEELASAARGMSALTHASPYALDACALWTVAIDRAIRTGELVGPRAGIKLIDESRQSEWERLISDAETSDPRRFTPNGFVVTALQAAWSAIHATRGQPDHFSVALRRAVSIGDDTDTVAAIAGALLGAAYGVTAIPFEWRHGLAGWPANYRATNLTRLAVRAVRRGTNDAQGWPDAPSLVEYYQSFNPTGVTTTFETDPQVIFGDVNALAGVEADAFISLCRIGAEDQRAIDHEIVWLLDGEGNADVGRVLADTADAIAQLRDDGRSVFVHDVCGDSRTPAVAMSWLMRHHHRTFLDAIGEIQRGFPTIRIHPSLLEGLRTCDVSSQG